MHRRVKSRSEVNLGMRGVQVAGERGKPQKEERVNNE
jgi:hypothetical protein